MSVLRETLEDLTQRWRHRRREARRRPEVLRKWYQWESASGKHVRVYYVSPRTDTQEIERIVQGCDETLQQIAALLAIKLTWRPVPVFLYPDDEAFRRCEQIQGWPYQAITRKGSISLPYGTWSSIAARIVHELTHIVSERYCGKSAIPLMEEGLATYVEGLLYPDAKRGLTPRLDLPLQSLANPDIMGKCLADHYQCRDTYAHVHAFASYLIDRYGMNAFLRVLKASSGRNWQQGEKRFTVAVQKVYGLTAEDIEHQWRQDNRNSS